MSDKNKHNKKEQDQAPKLHSEAADAETFDDLEEALEENEGSDNAEPEDMIATLTRQLEEEKAKVEKEKKEYLFLMAEFDNFRKRTVREKGDIIRNASEKVLSGLLPIVDDFERGLEAIKTTSDADTVKEGMQLIYTKLIKFLEQNGVKAIESNGTDFNPDLHEAIAMVPVEDESQKGKVIDTPTKGYTINDKVLRHAKVAVGQ